MRSVSLPSIVSLQDVNGNATSVTQKCVCMLHDAGPEVTFIFQFCDSDPPLTWFSGCSGHPISIDRIGRKVRNFS